MQAGIKEGGSLRLGNHVGQGSWYCGIAATRAQGARLLGPLTAALNRTEEREREVK